MLKSKKALILLVSLMVVVLGVAISLPVKATDSGTLPLDNLLAGLNSTDSNTTTNTTDSPRNFLVFFTIPICICLPPLLQITLVFRI